MKLTLDPMPMKKNLLTLAIAILGLVLATFKLSAQNTWYSKGDLTFNNPSNWNSLSDGTGANASIFSAGDSLIIQPGHTMSLNGGFSTASVNITIQDGGTINFNGWGVSGAGTLTLHGLGENSLGALINSSSTQAPCSKAITIGSPSSIGGTGNISISSLISGSYSLLKVGNGGLTLVGANTFSGGISISSGTLNIDNNSALGTGTWSIIGNCTINAINSARTISNPISISSSFTFTGTQNLSQQTGAIALTTSPSISVSSNTLALGGNVSGAFALTKSGFGTLTLSGANTFTGGVTLTSGTLKIDHDSALGIGVFTVSGGTVDAITTTRTISNPISISASFTFTGTQNLIQQSGAISLTTSPTITTNFKQFNIFGIISGAFGITKAGTGSMTFAGANTYTGTTIVSAGTLTLGAAGVIPDGSAVTVSSGATLAMNGFSETVGSIAGAGNISSASGNPVLTCGGDHSSTTFSGILGSGAISLVKIGSGTLTLSGPNTYLGTTTISAGVLTLGANNAIPVAATGGGVILNGGTLNTGLARSEGAAGTTNMGTLTLLENSFIVFGSSTTHNIYFANSDLVAWSPGKSLSISGWNGYGGSSGSGGKLFFGSTEWGITSSQRNQITINNLPVTSLSTGQVVPKALIFRSKQTGSWTDPLTWETSIDEITWANASVAPNNNYGPIFVRNGHTVTINTNLSIDQVTVDSGGVLNLGFSSLVIMNGTGDDVDVYGTFINANPGAITLNSATIKIQNGGIYRHAGNGGSLPTVNWVAGSTCEIVGITFTMVSGLGQTFSNFTWNCTSQSSNMVLGSSSMAIGGLFKVSSTGSTSSLTIGNSSFPITLATGSLEITGGILIITGFSASANIALNVAGDFTQSGGTFDVGQNSSRIGTCRIGGNATLHQGITRINNNTGSNNISSTLTIDGNLTIAGGTLDLAANATGTNQGQLFIKGNLSLTSGSLLFTRGASGPLTTGSSGVYFDGTSSQTFTHSGGSLSSSSGGIGRRFFYKTSSGPTELNEIYQASSAQTTILGTEGSPTAGFSAWPTSGGMINNLIINNPSGVSLSTPKQINGSLFLIDGTLNLGTNSLTFAGDSIHRTNGFLDVDSANILFNQSSTITLPSQLFSTQVKDWTMNGSGEVVLGSSINIQGEVTLTSGVINLGDYSFIAQGTLLGGSSSSFFKTSGTGVLHRFISGNGSYLFPIGDSLFAPITVHLASGNYSSATLSVTTKGEKIPTLNGNHTSFLNRYWSVEPSGITNPVYNISYSYNNHDLLLNGASEGDLVPIKKSGRQWYKPQSVLFPDGIATGTYQTDTQNNVLSWNNLTEFSLFGGTINVATPLPVELTYYEVKCRPNEDLEFRWRTGSERNNDFFTIEESQNGQNWNPLFVADGGGNSGTPLFYVYRFHAQHLTSSLRYYRLKQTDFDGSIRYLGMRSISCERETTTSFCNPIVGSVINGHVYSKHGGIAQIRVFSSNGKVITAVNTKMQRGENAIEIPLQNFRSGSYYVQVLMDGVVTTHKLIAME